MITATDLEVRAGARILLSPDGPDLRVQPGEMIGLVGHSGAGKTTMMNLVCRFFDVAEGAILVDGHDIRSYRINDYRRNIGIVLQAHRSTSPNTMSRLPSTADTSASIWPLHM